MCVIYGSKDVTWNLRKAGKNFQWVNKGSHAQKVMLGVFFSKECALPQNQTINREYYKSKELQKEMWFIHNVSLTQFCVKNEINVLLQPPYVPDLAPCDFFFFLWPKISISAGRTPFWHHWLHKNVYDHFKRNFPELLCEKCVNRWGEYFCLTIC